MMFKRKYLAIGIAISALIYSFSSSYLGSYFLKSRSGMIENIEVGMGRKPAIWTFQGCRMRVHFYSEGQYYDEKLVKREEQLLEFYRPLVRFDRLLGNYHLLDEDIPEMGG